MEVPTNTNTNTNTPILATPLFVHKHTNTSISHTSPCKKSVRSGERPTLSSLSTPSSISPSSISSSCTSGYERRVIDRIVTAVPYTSTSTHTSDNTNGEVEVCIEEYRYKYVNTNRVRVDHNTAPLLRRVAVRTYGHVNANGNANVSGNIHTKSKSDNDEGGLLQASFSLPIAPLPRREQSHEHSHEHSHWLCWTKFQKNSKPKSSLLVDKPYLCALTGPNTLRIFDVYPNPSNNDNTTTSAQSVIGVGEGHTVSLPFEASSIFPLPSPYGGLLIQRVGVGIRVGNGNGNGNGAAIDEQEENHNHNNTSFVSLNYSQNQHQQHQNQHEMDDGNIYCPHSHWNMNMNVNVNVNRNGVKKGQQQQQQQQQDYQGLGQEKHAQQNKQNLKDVNDIDMIQGPPSTVRLGGAMTTVTTNTTTTTNATANTNTGKPPLSSTSSSLSPRRQHHQHHVHAHQRLYPRLSMSLDHEHHDHEDTTHHHHDNTLLGPDSDSDSEIDRIVISPPRSSRGRNIGMGMGMGMNIGMGMGMGMNIGMGMRMESSMLTDHHLLTPPPPTPPPPPPSVYSLHHPLDEVRPCVIIPHNDDDDDTNNNNNDDDDERTRTRTQTRAGNNTTRTRTPSSSSSILNFCNIHERIIHVQKPRCFYKQKHKHQHLHKHTKRRQYSPMRRKNNNDVMVVTYNVKKQCHGVWILKDAPPPPPPVPLWKMTSTRVMTTNEHNNDGDGDGDGGDNHDVDGNVGGTNLKADSSKTDEAAAAAEETMMTTMFSTTATTTTSQRDSSPFSGLHANISMTCIHSTSWLSSSSSSLDHDDHAHDVEEDAMSGSDSNLNWSGLGQQQQGQRTSSSSSSCQRNRRCQRHRRQATCSFLATTADGAGDFILCMLLKGDGECDGDGENAPGNVNAGADAGIGADASANEKSVLKCLEFNPFHDDDETSTNNANNTYAHQVTTWKLKAEYEIPCKSAQPIQSTDVQLKSFLIDGRQNHGQGHGQGHGRNDDSLFSWSMKYGIHGDEAPKAIDILTISNPCSGPSSSKDFSTSPSTSTGTSTLSLHRGDIHLSDVTIPTPEVSNTNALNTSMIIGPFAELRNAVNNRVDLICGGHALGQQNNVVTIRTSFSLRSVNSAITDLALSAIGSALLDESESPTLVDGENNGRLLHLYFAIKTDCVKFAQYRSTKKSSIRGVSDIEWDSFTTIIASFLAVANGSSLSLNYETSGSSRAMNDDGGGNDDGDDEAWLDLLQSDFHAEYTQKNGNRLFLGQPPSRSDKTILNRSSDDSANFINRCECIKWVSNQTNSTLSIASSRIFDAIHIIYEDMKIRRSADGISRVGLLGDFLQSLCESSRSGRGELLMSDFITHYKQDIPPGIKRCNKIYGGNGSRICKRITMSSRPFCAYSCLEDIVEGQTTDHNLNVNGTCWRLGALLQFYSILFDDTITNQRERDRKLVSSMVESGLVDPSSLFDSFPPSLSLPLMDALHRCRSNPPHLIGGWNSLAYDLIGRNDLAKIRAKSKPMRAKDSSDVSGAFPRDDPENDGLVLIEKYSAMIFPNDSRVREAARLLRSSRPVFLRVQRAVEVNDHDYERMKQQKLALLCRRVLPLPVGRGMMTIGTLGKIPIEALPIPKICLSGRIPPQNAILALEENRCTSKHKMWPDFHNGVATGLRLPLASEDGKRKITRTWIVCNKPNPPQNNNTQPNQPNPPPEPDHTYGGFLLALGLRGHLASLSNNDIFDFINEGPFTTAVGVMLGLAANKRGTCDMTVSKTLCVHIPSLLPNSFQSIDLASPVQTAAVTGVGLLYQGSAHRLWTEFLLNEMSKRPTVDQNTDDREGYTLCCGLSLGMVNLCLRDGSTKSVNDGLSDLNIEERLHRYIVGGIEENSTRQRNRNDRGSNGMNAENEKSSRIYEGNMINVDITAPGATLALGMIYHRSGSKSVASLLNLPETAFALDSVRPDFLFLRVISKSLILWDNIRPDEDWMQIQIPPFIRHSYMRFKRKAEKSSGLDGLATFAAMTMDGNGDIDKEMKEDSNPSNGNNGSNDGQNSSQHDDTDVEVNFTAIRQAHAYIIAGLCFSIGLRFAGTGNSIAARSISAQILELQKLRDDSDPVSSALRPDMPTVELCLGASALSLGMVMAGTGDIESFKLLKKLRWKCEMDVKYGNHMAYASAIGLLFLGGGTCTLGNEPADIAALLIAFFPRYPVFTHDNRYHLQALRHLYALAVRKRKIEAIDVDSNEKVLVPMKLDFEDGSPSSVMTPSILLNRGRACKITVYSDRYYPVEVVLEDVPAFNKTLSLFVKKKSGRLSHIQDPHGLPSLFAIAGSDRRAALEYINSFIEDRGIIAYANYICSSNDMCGFLRKTSKDASISSLSLGDFCVDVIQECLRDEKTEAITIYLYLYNALHSIEKEAWPSRTARDFRFLRKFYQSFSSFELVSPLFIAMLCERVDKFFSSVKSREGISTNYDDLCLHDSQSNHENRWTGPTTIWMDHPALNR